MCVSVMYIHDTAYIQVTRAVQDVTSEISNYVTDELK